MTKLAKSDYMGPAMRALNERQRAFVVAAQQIGGGDVNRRQWKTRAARLAGYTGTDSSINVQACRLAENPKVQAAIKELALSTVSSEPLAAIGILVDIAHGEIPATASERIKAVNSILSRAGMPETTEHKVKVEHTVENSDAIEKLYRFAKVLGQDPKTLVGAMGMEIIEGKFREVQPQALIEVAPEDLADDFTFDPEEAP